MLASRGKGGKMNDQLFIIGFLGGAIVGAVSFVGGVLFYERLQAWKRMRAYNDYLKKQNEDGC
jgi:hypothetical protein